MDNRIMHDKKTVEFFLTLGMQKNEIINLISKFHDITHISYVSEFFGKISIVTTNDAVRNHTVNELIKLDSIVKERIQMKKSKGQLSALKAYAQSFFYLNKKNPYVTTMISHHSFVDYLEKSANEKQQNVSRDLASIILISDDIMQQIVLSLNNTQAMLIMINHHVVAKEILKNILREIQHWYNSFFLYVDNNQIFNFSDGLFQTVVNEWTKIINVLKSNDKAYPLMGDIKSILLAFANDNKRRCGALSSYLTFLLIDYSLEDIRKIIDLMLKNVHLASKAFHQEITWLGNEITAAFHIVEKTIQHLSVALYHFTLNKTTEAFETYADKNYIFNIMTPSVIHLNMIEHNSWEKYLEVVNDINNGARYILNAALYHDLAYSLREQAKMGNDKMINILLGITRIDIDKPDQYGLTPLAHAVMYHRHTTVKLLFHYGASLRWIGNIEDVNNNTLLHLSITHFNFKMIPWLLKKGLSASAINFKKHTPLLIAAKCVEKICLHGFFNEENDKASVIAISYLLSYSNENGDLYRKNESQFYQSLISFRKTLAFLYAFIEIDSAIHYSLSGLFKLAIKINGDLLWNDVFKKYYQAILTELQNQGLFYKFIERGINDVYQEMMKLNINKEGKIIIRDNINKVLSNDEEKLATSIFEVCKKLDINQMKDSIYQDLIILLKKLVIEEKEPTMTYSPKMFVQKLRLLYQESVISCEQDDTKKLVIN